MGQLKIIIKFKDLESEIDVNEIKCYKMWRNHSKVKHTKYEPTVIEVS